PKEAAPGAGPNYSAIVPGQIDEARKGFEKGLGDQGAAQGLASAQNAIEHQKQDAGGNLEGQVTGLPPQVSANQSPIETSAHHFMAQQRGPEAIPPQVSGSGAPVNPAEIKAERPQQMDQLRKDALADLGGSIAKGATPEVKDYTRSTELPKLAGADGQPSSSALGAALGWANSAPAGGAPNIV